MTSGQKAALGARPELLRAAPGEADAFLVGSAVELPPAVECAADAVRQAWISQEEADRLDVVGVHVGTEPAPVLAAAAARRAAVESGIEPDRVGHLMHGHIYYQGHDFWSPAHFIAHEAGFEQCVPMTIGQMCNGGAAALDIAVQRIRSARPGDPTLSVATTADTFGGPGFVRWGSDYDTVYGDGGTCAILAPRPGPHTNALRIRALGSRAQSRFEAMYREGDAFGTAPHQLRPAVDAKATKRAFFERSGGTEEFRDTAVKAIGELVGDVIDTAGVRVSDVRATMLPRLSPKVLDLMYSGAIDSRLRPTLHCERRTTGHLGAGDFLANLDHLRRTELIDEGQYALVIGGGGGFTWSAALVQKVGPAAPRG
ncbi:3-oxoacyl-[acyl-carrier-protein] synthase III C-terminal domain-containing protein [Streptomyces sp. NBC_00483]|uniref:3-oxoacyl-[acyl-carrier-protein] synthase III C-terminal domain-containing protein n=1 Tax=Streptomyces sp. NBC_00483 TaxID=2975756 RepID=UPI002E18FE0C